MAYVIPEGALCQVIFEGRHEGQQVMSVFSYKRKDEAGVIPDGAVALNSLWTIISGATGLYRKWTACLSHKVTNIRVRLQWVHPDRFAYVQKISGVVTTGEVLDDAMPVNTAVAITKRTQNAGRDQVGTLHMPGIPKDWIENGVVTATGIEKYDALATQMLVVQEPANPAIVLAPVLYDRSTPEDSQTIVNFTVHTFARIMRRRTVGLGA